MRDPTRVASRRWHWRGACWGITLAVCGCVAFWKLERESRIDAEAWMRKVRGVVYGGDTYRRQVAVGMTRKQIHRLLGDSDKRETYITISICIQPGSIGPLPPSLAYPLPFNKRDEYPEYGFDVVYHGNDVRHLNDWGVIAVEDHK